jgi:hypothetical protein
VCAFVFRAFFVSHLGSASVLVIEVAVAVAVAVISGMMAVLQAGLVILNEEIESAYRAHVLLPTRGAREPAPGGCGKTRGNGAHPPTLGLVPRYAYGRVYACRLSSYRLRPYSLT